MERILFEQTTAEELSTLVAEKVGDEIKKLLPGKEIDDLISRKETASFLKISLPTLRKWTVVGRLKSYKIGGRIRYKKSEVKTALKEIPY